MPMRKEFIQKKHPCKKLKSNERGECPILPIYLSIRQTQEYLFIVVQNKMNYNPERSPFLSL